MMFRILAAAAFIAGAAAAPAQTVATHSTTTTTTSTPKIGATKVAMNTSRSATVSKVDGSGHMATATTKTGKKITYDCSKAGNKNKTACKK